MNPKLADLITRIQAKESFDARSVQREISALWDELDVEEDRVTLLKVHKAVMDLIERSGGPKRFGNTSTGRWQRSRATNRSRATVSRAPNWQKRSSKSRPISTECMARRSRRTPRKSSADG